MSNSNDILTIKATLNFNSDTDINIYISHIVEEIPAYCTILKIDHEKREVAKHLPDGKPDLSQDIGFYKELYKVFLELVTEDMREKYYFLGVQNGRGS